MASDANKNPNPAPSGPPPVSQMKPCHGDDLVGRLRALARNEHDDHSVGHEAAARIEELEAVVDRLTADGSWSCKELTRLREALIGVEWVQVGYKPFLWCPSCKRTDPSGHARDCKLAAALTARAHDPA